MTSDLLEENQDLRKRNKELIALIKAERERQEKCDDVHLRKIADLEKENAELKAGKNANEWHYVKDGDLPRNDTKVLVLLENKRLKISIFMENVFTIWNKDYDAYTKLYGVIAWKEIVLPELKEIE